MPFGHVHVDLTATGATVSVSVRADDNTVGVSFVFDQPSAGGPLTNMSVERHVVGGTSPSVCRVLGRDDVGHTAVGDPAAAHSALTTSLQACHDYLVTLL